MQVPWVMTVIGKDRPGLVESVARIVAGHGGNWLESRMCRLGGEFAGLLRVQIPRDRADALHEELKQLEAQGLTIVMRPDEGTTPSGAPRLARLEILGQDRPGIVREISRALASQGVNVEELRTECTSAPMSGEALFRAQASLQLPAGCDLARLRQELERVAGDLLIDVTFEEVAVLRGTGRTAQG